MTKIERPSLKLFFFSQHTERFYDAKNFSDR